MPRKSSASLAIPRVDGSPPRLEPPSSLSPTERRLFNDLVAAVDRRHFRTSDLPLVCAYVRACDLEARAAAALSENPCDGKSLAVWEKAVRGMVALSLRLRLSPQARLSNRDVGRQRPLPVPRPWGGGD